MKYSAKNTITSVLVITTVLFLFSCKGRVSSDSETSKNTVASDADAIKMVEIPSVITDNGLRVKYLLDHFWDNLDMKDTSVAANPANIREPFRAYLNVLAAADFKSATESIVNLAKKVKVSNIKIINCFLEIFEKSLYESNSLYKNEEIYLAVANEILSGTDLPFEIKEKLSFQIRGLSKNRIHTKAADINFITPDGKELSLYSVKASYTLLFFYEPDCHSCNLTVDMMKNSPVLREAGGKIKIVAVYTGDNAQLWKNYNKNMSKEWIVGFDSKHSVINNSIYDIRSSPSMYLLDSNKIILLKDVTYDNVAEYFSTVK